MFWAHLFIGFMDYRVCDIFRPRQIMALLLAGNEQHAVKQPTFHWTDFLPSVDDRASRQPCYNSWPAAQHASSRSDMQQLLYNPGVTKTGGDLASCSVDSQLAELPCHPCGHCAYSTTRESSLRRHLAAKHKGGGGGEAVRLLAPPEVGSVQLDSSWWPCSRLEPKVELTVGSSFEKLGPAVANLTSSHSSLDGLEGYNHPFQPVAPSDPGTRVLQPRESYLAGGGICAGNRQKPKQHSNSRHRPVKKSSENVGLGDLSQVTLGITRTKVVLRRRRPDPPKEVLRRIQPDLPQEEYSFKCYACPFATNQTPFLAKHVSRHHK